MDRFSSSWSKKCFVYFWVLWKLLLSQFNLSTDLIGQNSNPNSCSWQKKIPFLWPDSPYLQTHARKLDSTKVVNSVVPSMEHRKNYLILKRDSHVLPSVHLRDSLNTKPLREPRQARLFRSRPFQYVLCMLKLPA